MDSRGIPRRLTGRVLRPMTITGGYYMVHLRKDGLTVPCKIHRLVAEAFIGPAPEGLQVNHRDGVKTNNRAENLEWVTRSENMQHAYAMGLR